MMQDSLLQRKYSITSASSINHNHTSITTTTQPPQTLFKRINHFPATTSDTFLNQPLIQSHIKHRAIILSDLRQPQYPTPHRTSVVGLFGPHSQQQIIPSGGSHRHNLTTRKILLQKSYGVRLLIEII